MGARAGRPAQATRGARRATAAARYSRAMERTFLVLGAISAGISVAAGAFGAHALRARLSPDLLAVFETGARYEMYHALGLVAAAWAASRAPAAAGAAAWAGWLFVAGTVLFSGSLYVLTLTGIRALGAVTPFGGVAFLAGWIALAVAALRG
jgi:uncharacterized membrane protein YgdD (TMEM256/DUF423 family)